MDTFAWHNPNIPLTIFEVDHPSTQQFKLQRLQQAGLECPNHLKFVSIDFTKERSIEKLISAGFDPHKKTIFSLLGVTYYLTKEVLQQLFDTLFKDLPIGSSIVFDFADERLFSEKGIYHRVQHMVQLL